MHWHVQIQFFHKASDSKIRYEKPNPSITSQSHLAAALSHVLQNAFYEGNMNSAE